MQTRWKGKVWNIVTKPAQKVRPYSWISHRGSDLIMCFWIALKLFRSPSITFLVFHNFVATHLYIFISAFGIIGMGLLHLDSFLRPLFEKAISNYLHSRISVVRLRSQASFWHFGRESSFIGILSWVSNALFKVSGKAVELLFCRSLRYTELLL